MKVAILGANGKAGSAILKEAKKRGLDVTAIVRNAAKITDGTPVIEKDVYKLTTDDIKDFDVLVSALGFWGDVSEFSGSTQHLIDILTNQTTRLFVVGGAGSLFVNPEHTVRLSETPDFPEAFKPLATAMGKGLELLEDAKNVNWTYISPAAEFDAEGVETGKYVTAGEELEVDSEGKSYISYADYAIAMVDEIEKNAHPNQRFSVHQ
ncbi:hypothetical protein IGJ02_003135 [Enterococcus sp. DIV0724b]|uniref:NAD(P)-dependent oxidoreductase n=1 Tax=Enterococcus sp. DIV0724b TaxID=2774694 RepID=UPI003D2FADEC